MIQGDCQEIGGTGPGGCAGRSERAEGAVSVVHHVLGAVGHDANAPPATLCTIVQPIERKSELAFISV